MVEMMILNLVYRTVSMLVTMMIEIQILVEIRKNDQNFFLRFSISWKLRDAPLVANFQIFYEMYDLNGEKVYEQDCESLTRLNSDNSGFNLEYIKDMDDFVDDMNLFSFDQIGRFGVVYMISFKSELMKVTRVAGVTRDNNNKHNNNNNTRIVGYLTRSLRIKYCNVYK